MFVDGRNYPKWEIITHTTMSGGLQRMRSAATPLTTKMVMPNLLRGGARRRHPFKARWLRTKDSGLCLP